MLKNKTETEENGARVPEKVKVTIIYWTRKHMDGRVDIIKIKKSTRRKMRSTPDNQSRAFVRIQDTAQMKKKRKGGKDLARQKEKKEWTEKRRQNRNNIVSVI